jgi:hypothetical protein
MRTPKKPPRKPAEGPALHDDFPYGFALQVPLELEGLLVESADQAHQASRFRSMAGAATVARAACSSRSMAATC